MRSGSGAHRCEAPGHILGFRVRAVLHLHLFLLLGAWAKQFELYRRMSPVERADGVRALTLAASAVYGELPSTNDVDFVVGMDAARVAPLAPALRGDFYVSESAMREAGQLGTSFNAIHTTDGNQDRRLRRRR